jgi:hypothetical protein
LRENELEDAGAAALARGLAGLPALEVSMGGQRSPKVHA